MLIHLLRNNVAFYENIKQLTPVSDINELIDEVKRIPSCHCSGQSCPGESGHILKKWQRWILLLTRNYHNITEI